MLKFGLSYNMVVFFGEDTVIIRRKLIVNYSVVQDSMGEESVHAFFIRNHFIRNLHVECKNV